MRGPLHVRRDEEPDVTDINYTAVDLRGFCTKCGNNHLSADCPLTTALLTSRIARRVAR